ncbi:MAG: hypothetical protein WAO98_10880 [Alphaproteobacteria bacterium]
MRYFFYLFLLLFILLLPAFGYAQMEFRVPPGVTMEFSPGVNPKVTTDEALTSQIVPTPNVIQDSSQGSALIPPPPVPGNLLALPWDICAKSAGQVRLCGQLFNLNKLRAARAFANDPGTAVFTMPEPFVPDRFFVSCAGNSVFPNLTIAAPDVSCRYQPCKDMTATICGRDFQVPGEVEMDKMTSLSWLQNPTDARDANTIFKAQCTIENGERVYAVDMKGMFCSQLPCPEGKIRLCDTDILVPEGTAAGAIIDMVMPEPFVPDPYVVQCLGSGGKAPTYQLVDHINVSCEQKNP